ncbi:MAG: phage holin family protein, partial [Oscillospiraceae bacterium]|nr:phage holin family protein [Oscillospiraceae bacterium]MBR7190113.1 phage holin family protein [Oscillospiraceae bacterium]
MKENIIKGALAVLLTGAAAYFRQLLAPVIVLLIVMIIDYVTGMVQAWASSTLSSRVGIMGIVKKIGYLLAIAVAVV